MQNATSTWHVALCACLALAGIFGVNHVLPAQSFYGSMVGTVTDATGAVVADAEVILINMGTSERRTAATDVSGNYQFVNLVPGRYRIEITKTGFRRLTRDEIVVEVQSTVRIDAPLTVGDVGQVVEVQAETPLLQTETSSLGQVVQARAVQQMPLNGRNVLNLVALVPGVAPQGQSLGNPTNTNISAWGNYQIGGGIGNESAAYLDGGPLNTGYNNAVQLVPTQDAILEFRVQTNNLGAEFGRFGGGVVNMTSKSGTNELHGSVYEFLRNRVLNANTFFNNRAGVATPAFTQNQFGANAGGRIIKDKTFFFVSYEGFRLRQGLAASSCDTGWVAATRWPPSFKTRNDRFCVSPPTKSKTTSTFSLRSFSNCASR
jgi:Carboxypeptidase regulatory-like domain